MATRPGLRRFALTAHVISSVGWLGAVAVFLALSVAGLTSDDPDVVRAVYIAMEAIGWLVLVPLSVASLVTGLIQSLGTKWGLFRHYWVVTKLLINLVATVVLVLYMGTLDHLSGLASATRASGAIFEGLRNPSPVLHAGIGLLLLLAAAGLSVYKPRGMTRYGQRKQRRERASAAQKQPEAA